MARLTITDRDIKMGQPIEPAWYKVLIEDVEESLSKDQQSTNWVLKAKVLNNADTGDEKFKDMPVPRWAFNSKAAGFVIPLLTSLGFEVKPGMEIDFNGLKGQTPIIFIENGLYEGRTVNQFNNKYRAAK